MANIVLDMDGTLADFNGGGGLDKMHNKGFFQNLTPYPRAQRQVKKWQDLGHEIYILSACIDSDYCIAEKLIWINKHYPFIKKQNILLVPVGTNKAEYFENFKGSRLNSRDLLFDDYKINLQDWNLYGGTAVKCGKTFKKYRKFVQVIKWRLAKN